MIAALAISSLMMLPPGGAEPAAPPAAASSPAPSSGPRTDGAGHELCRAWIAAETKPDQSDYYANRFWVAGFMSAYNWYVSAGGFDIGRGLSRDDTKAYMHAECASHPSETVATAAAAMLAMQKARQSK